MIHLKEIGTYLPPNPVTAEEIDKKLNVESGWTLNATGVQKRYFIEGETAAMMGAKALRAALDQTDLSLQDLNAIVCVSGTTQQLIPCTASLIAAELGLKDGMMAFDINATCLSFLIGLDLMAGHLSLGRYQTIALVASEIASVGLNWDQKESAALFGDGAAAVILSNKKSFGSKILSTHFETYPEGVAYCQIRGGSTLLHAKYKTNENLNDYLFDMHGSKLFKLALQKMPLFLEKLLAPINLSLHDIDLVIPHQASLQALNILQKRLGLPDQKFFINVQEQGNTIAASIPLALQSALEHGRISKGDKVLLLGSSAGVSLGGVIIEY